MNFSDCFLEFVNFILQIGNFFIGRFFGLIMQVLYQSLRFFYKLPRRIFKAVKCIIRKNKKQDILNLHFQTYNRKNEICPNY